MIFFHLSASFCFHKMGFHKPLQTSIFQVHAYLLSFITHFVSMSPVSLGRVSSYILFIVVISGFCNGKLEIVQDDTSTVHYIPKFSLYSITLAPVSFSTMPEFSRFGKFLFLKNDTTITSPETKLSQTPAKGCSLFNCAIYHNISGN